MPAPRRTRRATRPAPLRDAARRAPRRPRTKTGRAAGRPRRGRRRRPRRGEGGGAWRREAAGRECVPRPLSTPRPTRGYARGTLPAGGARARASPVRPASASRVRILRRRQRRGRVSPPPPPAAAPSSLRARLATAGASGLAAMALCNAVWYSTLFVLSAGAARPAPGQGVAAAWRAAAVTLAYTYGASQLSKVPRSFAILALVPALDRGLTRPARQRGARGRTRLRWPPAAWPRCWPSWA